MKMLRIFCWICLCQLVKQQTRAQEITDTAKLFDEVNSLQSLYKDRALSFEMRYIYTSELKPSIVLDSMQGKIVIDGSRYKYELENMETISNGQYNIVLFKEEKLMYIARPSSLAGIDPVEQIRQMLLRSGATGYSLSENASRKTLQIHFVQGGPCREMELVIDKKERHLLSVKYLVKTELLTQNAEAATGKTDPAYGPYAIVKAFFSHYEAPGKDTSWQDSQTYFYKDGTTLLTTPAYKEYKIFKGSPNL